jgi:hypothetical protein
MMWLILLVLLALLFGLGTVVHVAAHILWLVFIVLVVLWLIGYVARPRR